jgi:hypothetical protein
LIFFRGWSVVDVVVGVAGVDGGVGLSGADTGVLARGCGAGRFTTGRGGGGALWRAGSGVAVFDPDGLAAAPVSTTAGAVNVAPAAAAAGTGGAAAGTGGGAVVGDDADASSGVAPRSRLKNNQPPTTATANTATATMPCRRLRAGSCDERSVAPATC